MLQSKLFSKTIREAPKDEKSINAQLLVKAGFIDRLASGIYTFLPLGYKVIKKIETIIKEEMEEIGGQELLLPALHPKEIWQKTGRWETMEDLYKLRAGKGEFALGPTHEEVVVPLAKKFIQTYKDLPTFLFQIQTKFRKEKRAKSGLLRGREFLMKDLYSFHTSETDLDEYYEKVKGAYFNILKRVGIAERTYLTYASGGTFSKYSHEFQTTTSAGEDIIYICQKCGQAVNKEIKPETPRCPNCQGKLFKREKAVEVGNIFKLKTKFSEPFGLYFTDRQGQKKLVQMGCYGIGLGRLMGTVVEIFHDEKGIIWPKEVAPFQIHLIELESRNSKLHTPPPPSHPRGGPLVRSIAEKIYQNLLKGKSEVLYDDRNDRSAGEKFADCDLIGIPTRIVISERTLKQSSVEFKKRNEKKTKLVKISNIKNFLIAQLTN